MSRPIKFRVWVTDDDGHQEMQYAEIERQSDGLELIASENFVSPAVMEAMGSPLTNVVFKNYAKDGDQMIVGFDSAAKKVATINVNTYMDKPGDAVTLAVQMGSLPDGTNYAQQTVLNATAKQIQVTTTNSNYAKIQ